jgi:hypothetical protein
VFLTATLSTSVLPSGCSTAEAITIETPEDEPVRAQPGVDQNVYDTAPGGPFAML